MKRNCSIDSLRMVAAILVVVLHVSAPYVIEGMHESNFNINFWVGNFIGSFARICVPIFVLISGGLLIGKNEAPSVYYNKRISRILFPTLFWSIIYSLFKLIFRYMRNNTWDFNSIFKSIVFGTPYYHLWYLYMLIGLYAIVPVINILINNITKRKLWLIAWCFVIFGFTIDLYDTILGNKQFFMLWFIKYIGYFLLGFLVKDTKKYNVTILSIIYILSSLLIAILTYFTIRYFNSTYFYGYLSPFVVLCSLCIYKIFSQTSIEITFLTRHSHLAFGIYLIHAGILDVVKVAGDLFKIQYHKNSLFGILFQSVIVFAISLVFSNLLYRQRLLRKII